MKKQLFILRHAKSDWSADFSWDFDRPLSKHGHRDAKRVGQWMAQQQLPPDYILCSPAKRAQSTLKHMMNSFKNNSFEVDFTDSLYLADLATLLLAIQSAPGSCQRLLLVGHNPGLEELVIYLSNKKPLLTNKGKIFTTANLAIMQVNNFNNLTEHCAELQKLLRPSELID